MMTSVLTVKRSSAILMSSGVAAAATSCSKQSMAVATKERMSLVFMAGAPRLRGEELLADPATAALHRGLRQRWRSTCGGLICGLCNTV